MYIKELNYYYLSKILGRVFKDVGGFKNPEAKYIIIVSREKKINYLINTISLCVLTHFNKMLCLL